MGNVPTWPDSKVVLKCLKQYIMCIMNDIDYKLVKWMNLNKEGKAWERTRTSR